MNFIHFDECYSKFVERTNYIDNEYDPHHKFIVKFIVTFTVRDLTRTHLGRPNELTSVFFVSTIASEFFGFLSINDDEKKKLG